MDIPFVLKFLNKIELFQVVNKLDSKFEIQINMIGWIIAPIGTIITLWVLFKKVKGDSFRYYLFLAIIWAFIAIVFDYFFLVKAFKPADGYYKLDVYLYYALTFILPLVVGWQKKTIKK